MANKGQFQKGHISWNKDKKGIHLSEKTEFKKGSIPHNTQPVGTINLHHHQDGQWFIIKIEEHKWVSLAKYNYEKVHGTIPQGLIIRHLDGNALNDNIENLKAISRAENARMNINRKKAADSMKKAYLQGDIWTDLKTAFSLSPFDKSLRTKLLKHPELLKLRKNQLILKARLRRYGI